MPLFTMRNTFCAAYCFSFCPPVQYQNRCYDIAKSKRGAGGTAAAAPPPFRPGNPALYGSCPLVTPYYCRLGDLLCYNCMLCLSYHFVCMHVYFVFFVLWVIFFCRFSFSTLILLVGSFDL